MDGGATEIVGEGSVPDLGGLERWWNNPGIAAWSFALFGCFLLNATLLLAFLIRPGLRTISNRFVMNLTASNLLTCVILNPLLIMDALSTSAPTSRAAQTSLGSICAISEGATALVTTSSVLAVLLIAVDQYFAVVDPLRYRARVDKLKSGILIMSVWLISAVFGILAFFNPNPRSIWLSCIISEHTSIHNTTMDLSLDTITESTFTVFENGTEEVDDSEIPGILKTIESIKIDSSIGLIENTTVIFTTLNNDSITYGLVYAIVHSLFAYLLPFAAVCWIYVSIYVAAHRNSERTRRTGSRPILASASFCEEQNPLSRPQQQVDTIEDFRRIPKISSLSSIDETSETTQPANQVPRRCSFSSASEIGISSVPVDEKSMSGVIFTVGSQRVEVSPPRTCNSEEDDRANRVPIATLKAEFLDTYRGSRAYEDFVRSKFRDQPDQRRKSSHDLMCEEIHARKSSDVTWITGESVDDISDSDDEDEFDCFNSTGVREKLDTNIGPEPSADYFSQFYECKASLMGNDSKNIEVTEPKSQSNGTDGIEVGNETRLNIGGDRTDHQRNEDFVHTKIDIEDRQGKASILRQPYEGRTSRRSSTTFALADIILNASESTNTTCNKFGKNTIANSTATESSSCLLAPIVTITPAPSKNGTLHRVSSVKSTSSYINSLKHRISNGSLFRYREETRAARISALVIVMGLICWSPYVILLVMKNLPQYSDQYLPHEYDVTAISFLLLAAYVSPLLFGYRSRRVKRELRKFFCFRRELSYKNNRSLMAKKVLKRRHSSTFSHFEVDHKYNIFNCVYGRSRWPKEKVQFVQVPDTALAVETCRSSFSSGASTQISSTSTEEC